MSVLSFWSTVRVWPDTRVGSSIRAGPIMATKKRVVARRDNLAVDFIRGHLARSHRPLQPTINMAIKRPWPIRPGPRCLQRTSTANRFASFASVMSPSLELALGLVRLFRQLVHYPEELLGLADK